MENIQQEKTDNSFLILEFGISEKGYEFNSDLKTELNYVDQELYELSSKLEENIGSIKKLTPECDKIDYSLASCSGCLSGIIDIILVGKPGESYLGNLSDKWVEKRIMDFAKICGWNDNNKKSISSAIRFLENKFKIPYDQRGVGDAGSAIFDLNPKNHHFKSLGHNPNLLGLFFSILNQFTNTSSFVTDGELISLQEVNGNFELKGNNVISKLFCGFMNWFGHLISDMSGSSNSKGRGMGIPAPILTFTNSIIAIKKTLNFPVTEFDKSVNQLALEVYEQGYDIRFQTAQTIPVLVNELMVRIFYSIRRLVKYFIETKKEERSFSSLWQECEPFSNSTVKRMLTVAHGTFCLVDISDSLLRSFVSGKGTLDIKELFMRLNIVGVGRFMISMYGEVNRGTKCQDIKKEIISLEHKKKILEEYTAGLKNIAEIYDDKSLLLFTKTLKESDMYVQVFNSSIQLAERRNVPENEILRNKTDIDLYFQGETNI